MPISKKPRSKTAPKTSTKTSAAAALPDRRAMESFLAAIAGRRGDDATAKAHGKSKTACATLSGELVTALASRFSGGRDSETGSSGRTHVAPSERWPSGWDHEFESPLLQRRVIGKLG